MESANLELVRSIYADWERGDFHSVEWAHAQIEFVSADGPDPGTWIGMIGMKEGFRSWLRTWEEFRLVVEEYRELDDHRVLVLDHLSGRGKISGLDLGQMRAAGAWLFDVHGGQVTRMVRYLDRDRGFGDLGLSPEGDAGDPPN